MRLAAPLAAAAALLSSAAADPVPDSYEDPVGPTQPWGLHIAYGSVPSSITAMWSTRDVVSASVCSVGLQAQAPALPLSFSGATIPFSDVGNVQTLHRVLMTGLAPGTTYAYQCGDGAGNMSALYNFTTMPGGDWAPTFAVYGDMGITANAEATMPWLLADALSGAIDAVLHIGDAAYNLESTNGKTGDAWMVQVEPLAARKAYMFCAGNHESSNDFYESRMRLGAAMPLARGAPSAGGNGTFYSFDAGLLHVVMVSSEVYFSVQPHSLGLAQEQATWLAADLAAVNRNATPFVVLGLHQPFYCSPNDDTDDCHEGLSLVRAGLEDIIYKGGVDVVFGAHEHSYERNYPVYQSKWNASRTGPGAYVDYTAPIHILTGAAGCPENQDPWQATGNPFSAVRINDYGYGRLTVMNRTTLRWVYIDNVAGQVKDEVFIVKHAPGQAFPA